jgi:FAD:protein FMN transferase
MTTVAPLAEQRLTFECFGSSCTVIVFDQAAPAAARAAAMAAQEQLLGWHEQFSRFREDSELTRLNADPRETVPVSPMMRRVTAVAIRAAIETGGLVDPTLAGEIEQAGYDGHFDGPGLALAQTLFDAPPRRAARPHTDARWRSVIADRRSGTVSRPPGVRIDPGGIAKGAFADELAASLAGHEAYVVECAGDLRLGGGAEIVRAVHVASPFGAEIIHTFELTAGGVATSGIGKRSWLRPDGSPAHHLLDPGTGEPAFTGIVQVTALAGTATEAETRSKAALLSGPEHAADWLPDGGVIVLDDGTVMVVAA